MPIAAYPGNRRHKNIIGTIYRPVTELANCLDFHGCVRGECLPADNSINTGPSEIILNKSPRLCHREMDASPQSRWLLGSGEGTRTESRVPAAAIGARAGGERALAEATGTSAAS